MRTRFLSAAAILFGCLGKLIADDANSADIDCEDDTARKHSEKQRLQEAEVRRDQDDGDNDEPVE